MRTTSMVALSVIFAVGLSGIAVAGSINSSGAPSSGSGMYTLTQIYDYLNSGTDATPLPGFQEPVEAPAPTMKTTKQIFEDIKAKFAECDTTIADVKMGKKFFSTVSGSWGVQTGTISSSTWTGTVSDLACGKKLGNSSLQTVTGTKCSGPETCREDGACRCENGSECPVGTYCDTVTQLCKTVTACYTRKETGYGTTYAGDGTSCATSGICTGGMCCWWDFVVHTERHMSFNGYVESTCSPAKVGSQYNLNYGMTSYGACRLPPQTNLSANWYNNSGGGSDQYICRCE
ncbi:MAG: hypothetical protein NTZ78_02345 [Candidatus Aureabacteria bacterium]|nr:hypothetical protein [Candidatus Auribacterota bacterium]